MSKNICWQIRYRFYSVWSANLGGDQQIWFWKTGGKWFKLVCSAIRRELEHPSPQFRTQKQQGLKSGIRNNSSTLFSPFLFRNIDIFPPLSLLLFHNIDMLRVVLQGMILNNADSLIIFHCCHNKISLVPQYMDIFPSISWYRVLIDILVSFHYQL